MSEFPNNPEDVAAQISTAGDEWSSAQLFDKYTLNDGLGWRHTNFSLLYAQEAAHHMIDHITNDRSLDGRTEARIVTIEVHRIFTQAETNWNTEPVLASAWKQMDGLCYYKIHPLEGPDKEGVRLGDGTNPTAAVDRMTRLALQMAQRTYFR